MKVIDLLNKIANGEEVPKRIKYRRGIYKWNGQYYMSTIHNADMENLSFDEYFCITGILNDEVEIIEDMPKEDKKIEKFKVIKDNEDCNVLLDYDNKKYIISVVDAIMLDKINEIIDKINGE